MEAFHRTPDGDVILLFVLQFYGRPSAHLWEDEEGVVRGNQQGMLFVIGQHQALVAD